MQCQRSWQGQGWRQAEVNVQRIETPQRSRRLRHLLHICSCSHYKAIVLFDCTCRDSKVTCFTDVMLYFCLFFCFVFCLENTSILQLSLNLMLIYPCNIKRIKLSTKHPGNCFSSYTFSSCKGNVYLTLRKTWLLNY